MRGPAGEAFGRSIEVEDAVAPSAKVDAGRGDEAVETLPRIECKPELAQGIDARPLMSALKEEFSWPRIGNAGRAAASP